VFVPDPDDEAVDPDDPPLDPDPIADELDLAFATETLAEPTTDEEAIAIKARCPARSKRLSPRGLTFAIHIPRKDDNAAAAFKQLSAVRHLIRARDIFVIERNAPVVHKLRQIFPCNEFHFIAFPAELDNAFALGKLVDGIAVDWEKGVWENPEGFSVDKLTGYADKIRLHHAQPSVVPYWPDGFDDGRIVQASNMGYELAQIQNRCAHDSALAYAGEARSLVANFRAHNLSARDIGFEISLDSFADADNHTGVDRSVACTRKAYGKGARAIYLYGNGHPHLDDYLHRIAKLGLRSPR
jgi:hypothetical protein